MAAQTTSNPCLVFTTRRQKPELIQPVRPTPREIKPLSDIDSQGGFWFYVPMIQFYRRKEGLGDPVKVIKAALAEALVYYYPLAGRLREVNPGSRMLVVECTGEGIVFMEADADVGLQEFGEFLQPPFPCLEELMFDVPGTSDIVHCPLLLVQVTRLQCGGFILTLRFNHSMMDANGLMQFYNTVAEIARHYGTSSLQQLSNIAPVWDRHLLSAWNPPRVTCAHNEFEEVGHTKGSTIFQPDEDMVHQSFFFGPNEISMLKNSLPLQFRPYCSSFDVITACLWRCRTIALAPHPDEVVRVLCVADARSKFNPPIPKGYYGNTVAMPAAVSTAKELSSNPFSYAVQLVRETKQRVTEEYMRSLAALMVLQGRLHVAIVGTFIVSNLAHFGYEEIDYGWGKPVFGGVAEAGGQSVPGLICILTPTRKTTTQKENGILAPISLSRSAMARFAHQLHQMLTTNVQGESGFIKSAL